MGSIPTRGTELRTSMTKKKTEQVKPISKIELERWYQDEEARKARETEMVERAREKLAFVLALFSRD